MSTEYVLKQPVTLDEVWSLAGWRPYKDGSSVLTDGTNFVHARLDRKDRVVSFVRHGSNDARHLRDSLNAAQSAKRPGRPAAPQPRQQELPWRPRTEAPAPKRVLQDVRQTAARPGNGLLYWAYGSNLSEANMRRRCPRAVKVGPLTVQDAALVFRGAADVVHAPGREVPGGLWLISPDCERQLDVFEGVSARVYMKRYLTLEVNGEERRCLYYQMRTHRGVLPPTEEYLGTIARGYEEFGLPLGALDRALRESWSNKELTEGMRARRSRRGGRAARPGPVEESAGGATT